MPDLIKLGQLSQFSRLNGDSNRFAQDFNQDHGATFPIRHLVDSF
jgi:hypothetical protein